eukprot:51683_1
MGIKHKKKKKKRDEEREKKEQEGRLQEIQEQIKKSNEEFESIKRKQQEVQDKLNDPNYQPEKEELTAHAMTLSIMLAEQKNYTQALKDSKQIIIDFLKEDDREALIAFFKIKGGL